MIVGIGIDLAEIARFRDGVARHGEGFLEGFLSADEIANCRTQPHPFSSYAAVFAAKEALSKSLGTGLFGALSWLDIKVTWEGRGIPRLRLRGEAERVAGFLGVGRIHLCLSHEREYAGAVVLLERA